MSAVISLLLPGRLKPASNLSTAVIRRLKNRPNELKPLKNLENKSTSLLKVRMLKIDASESTPLTGGAKPDKREEAK